MTYGLLEVEEVRNTARDCGYILSYLAIFESCSLVVQTRMFICDHDVKDVGWVQLKCA